MNPQIKSVMVASTLFFSMSVAANIDGPIMLTLGELGTSEALAWSWGASHTINVGGGGGAARTNFQDISVTRYSDGLSASILKAVALGEMFNTVELKRDGMRIRLQNTLITSYSVGGSDGKKEFQSENVTFAFTRVIYEIDGSPAYCFDIESNTNC